MKEGPGDTYFAEVLAQHCKTYHPGLVHNS